MERKITENQEEIQEQQETSLVKVQDYRAERENQLALDESDEVLVSITYYPTFKVPAKNGAYITLSGVFKEVNQDKKTGKITESLSLNGQLIMIQRDGQCIWQNESLEQMADAQLLEGETEEETEMKMLEGMNEEQALIESKLLEGEEEQLVLEGLIESEQEVTEENLEMAEQLEDEVESEKELASKVDLQIVPGTSQQIKPDDVKDIPELKGGKKIESAYSKKLGWVILKDGELAMGPAITTMDTMHTVDEYGNKEVSTQSPHGTIRSSDRRKKISFSYGQYGEMKVEKVLVNPDGTELKRKLDTYGKQNFDKQTKLQMDEVRETSEIVDNYETTQGQDQSEQDEDIEFEAVNNKFNLETEVYIEIQGYKQRVTLEYVMRNVLKLNRADEFLQRVENADGVELEDKVMSVIEEVEQEFEQSPGRRR